MLRDLQLQMMDALYGGPSERVAALINSSKTESLARLRVYRNNVSSNFVEALRSTYPVVWRLVGEPYFRQIAHAFQLRHPSKSGDLQHAGESFSNYLAELHNADECRYLADVARLEWLVQEAWLSADHGSLDIAKLAGVEPSQYEVLRFKLHPALRLFVSQYPALRIWEVNVDSAREPEQLEMSGAADRLIVIRHGSKLEFHRLSSGEYRFLLGLRKGEAFLAAINAATESDSDFDATSALQRCVAIHAIVDFELAGSE